MLNAWHGVEPSEVSSPRLRCGDSQASGRCPSGDFQHPIPRASVLCPLSRWSLGTQGHLPGHQTSCQPGLPAQSPSQQPTRAARSLPEPGNRKGSAAERGSRPAGEGGAGHGQGSPRGSSGPEVRAQREGDPSPPNPMADSRLLSPRRREHPPLRQGPEGGSKVRSRKCCKSRLGKGHRVAPGSGGVGAVPGQVLLPLRPRDGAGSRVRGPGSRLAGSRVLGRPVPRPGSRARLAAMPSPTGPVPSAHLRPPAPAARAHLRCPGRRRRRRHWTRPPAPGRSGRSGRSGWVARRPIRMRGPHFRQAHRKWAPWRRGCACAVRHRKPRSRVALWVPATGVLSGDGGRGGR